jgi:hypothetical protein
VAQDELKMPINRFSIKKNTVVEYKTKRNMLKWWDGMQPIEIAKLWFI